MTNFIRKLGPHNFGGEPSQPVKQIQAPADTPKRDTVPYDAEDLSEFAYIFSREGFDFDDSGYNRRTSVVASAPALQQQQQQHQQGSPSPTGACSAVSSCLGFPTEVARLTD
jgi:hypothetical protein